MKKLMVYSHDTFGMGNISRMLVICRHLLKSIQDLSILLVTGSPVIQSLRLSQRLDYIKLPCLTRTEYEAYSVKYLGTEIDETIQLRSDLILSAAVNYKPDLLLVDKKPTGVKHELVATLNYLKRDNPDINLALVLRDILDSPENTIRVWRKRGYYDTIQVFYDFLFVLGVPEVFDPRKEYSFPRSVSDKVRFCGYLRRESGTRGRSEIRAELGLAEAEKLILVTPGGGQDGFEIIATYIASLPRVLAEHSVKSLIVCGPEMPEAERRTLYQMIRQDLNVSFHEFKNDFVSYVDAADVVVSMGGYNTICELLSLKKRAVIVPRAEPAQEQYIRSERMQPFGLFTVIHPHHLAPEVLVDALLRELNHTRDRMPLSRPDLDGLPRLADWVRTLLFSCQKVGSFETTNSSLRDGRVYKAGKATA